MNVDPLNANEALGHPVSPVSDPALGHIQTGAHSLSSTGSDLAVAIHTVNKEHLDSPPDLISPVGTRTVLFDNNSKSEPRPSEGNPNEELADMMTDYLFA